MNNFWSEVQIRDMHTEFLKCRTYKDKILVYDKHFGILTDKYPEFDIKLQMFYRQESLSELVELFENERRHSLPLEKTFMLGTELFPFNITPANTYPEVFNDYIIEKFLDTDPAYNFMQHKINDLSGGDIQQAIQMELEACKNIRTIELKVKSNAETSLRNKFMTVFYEGYSDHRQNNFKKFSKRKKIIELYLYSYGILFGRYIDALRNCIKLAGQGEHKQEGFGIRKELLDKLILLQETGVLEFLRQKYHSTEQSDDDHLITGIVCRLLGENNEQIQLVVNRFI